MPELPDAALEAAARSKGASKSLVIGKTLEERLGRHRAKKSPRAYDLVKDLYGAVDGSADLLTNPKHIKGFGA